ncbi:hypothetical protein [Ensifer sp. LCM 4579]|uniref:hypothetical protein n=1 Tax=Ensifer sp. LCM 4579 TaxID=1848292 RepID=UPI0008DAFC65|nr:hypothetical protein [Ensifer sp. LCM 4579]OHV85822.1 hypothetical protein LCM4579_00175 [Ensifer sp. LCM 4579]
MAIKDEENQREFLLLMEHARLTQAHLSGLLGVSHMTVNRWTSHRDDAVDPPYYALQFLRAYLMLPEPARARLTEKPSGKPVKAKS